MQKCLNNRFVKITAILFVITILLLPLWAQAMDKPGAKSDSVIIPFQRFFLDFNNARLIYIPATKKLQITVSDNVISFGSDLEICRVKPFLYHLRQKEWQGFYWKINTGLKKVYKVTEGTFCQLGGVVDRRLNITVEVEGGSASIPPTRFVLRFSKAHLVYWPGPGTLQIAAQDNLLSDGGDWQKCNVNGSTFHLKQNSWKDFYWQVLTENPAAHQITGASAFCNPGTFPMEPLEVDIRIVK